MSDDVLAFLSGYPADPVFTSRGERIGYLKAGTSGKGDVQVERCSLREPGR